MPNAFDDISPQLGVPEQASHPTIVHGNAFDDISPEWTQGRIQQGGVYSKDTSTPEWQAKFGPTAGMTAAQLFLAGTGRGLTHTARSIGNLIGLTPDSTLRDEREIDQPLLNTTAGGLGNLSGEAAATAPFGMVAGGALGKVAPALADSAIAQGALQGGLQGAITADPGEHGSQAIGGALTGGALGVLSNLGSTAIHGLNRSPSAQRLLEEGVDLTPGQMNPGGAFNQFEQAAESLPGAKQIIDPARENAERQYQALVIQAGAAPGANITPSENVHQMLQQAYDSYKPLYDQAKGFPVKPVIMQTSGPDVPLNVAFSGAALAPGVPDSIQTSEGHWLADRLTSLPRNPDSADLLNLRSEIRQRAREFGLKTDVNAAHISNIQNRADQVVTAALQSQLPGDALEALRTADSNYGNYKIVEQAVAKSKDNLAGLTPQKLSQAVYDAIPDPAYARGAGGHLRDLAQAGTDVFQNVSPPTGARILTLGAAGAGAYHPAIGIPVAGGMLATTGTRTGRAIAQGATRPQMAAARLAQALQVPATAPAYLRAIPGAASQIGQRAVTGALLPYGQQASTAALAAALLGVQKLGAGEKTGE